jgi:hypothetical protein
MAQITLGKGSRTGFSGLNEALDSLRALQKACGTREAKSTLRKSQAKGFEMIRSAVYGRKYGISLAEIFRKTRPRTKDDKRSVYGFGLGTPVKTGRLQKSLTTFGAPFSIYTEQSHTDGTIRVIYGGDPADPYTGNSYFKYPEETYGFFADGIAMFQHQRTLKALGEDLAYMYGKALQKHISDSVKKASR